jgi:histidine ammonia-lyase
MFDLGKDTLTPHLLVTLARTPKPELRLSPESADRVKFFRQTVEGIAASDKKVYGINTGFGFLSDVAIPKDQLRELQANLIRSHACGVGEYAAPELVRGILILRAHTFALGYSAISLGVLQSILDFLKHDILPLVPIQGSVGASGDLAPLAHLAMALMGEGQVYYQGKAVDAAAALQSAKIKPVQLGPKEGLSLINGTHFMAVVASFALADAAQLAKTADIAAALSLEGIRGTAAAFDPRIHEVRGQSGQRTVAANLRRLLHGPDPIMDSHADCGRVQDPYSFRCVPQVHGASRDAIEYCETVIQRELNSVTDNPLVFENGDVLSGGNFHGQPIAIAMDFLAIALAELGSISERRIEKLTNPQMSGLPAFLVKESGLNSGFMIPHVVAAALVSENKVLCHPASVDSIPTSADKEDHVSMGPISARKCRTVAGNVRNILAIELIAGIQAMALLAPLKPAPALNAICEELHKHAKHMERDRSLHNEIRAVADWIQRPETWTQLEHILGFLR